MADQGDEKCGSSKVLQERCYEAFIREDFKVSGLQKDVVAVLSAIGLNPVQEYLAESGYRLDALVEVDGKRFGIEVDGPFHFVSKTPNGSTFLKRREVTTIDKMVRLVSVPYWE